MKAPPEPAANVESTLRPAQQGLGSFRSGSLPNVAAPQATNAEPNDTKVPCLWNPLVFILTLVELLFFILW